MEKTSEAEENAFSTPEKPSTAKDFPVLLTLNPKHRRDQARFNK
jgi:hypothetical protein